MFWPYFKICTRLQVQVHFLLFAPATRLSCTRGSPSRGGIVARTLWPYAACSPDVA